MKSRSANLFFEVYPYTAAYMLAWLMYPKAWCMVFPIVLASFWAFFEGAHHGNEGAWSFSRVCVQEVSAFFLKLLVFNIATLMFGVLMVSTSFPRWVTTWVDAEFIWSSLLFAVLMAVSVLAVVWLGSFFARSRR